jgi:hypothetical protein
MMIQEHASIEAVRFDASRGLVIFGSTSVSQECVREVCRMLDAIDAVGASGLCLVLKDSRTGETLRESRGEFWRKPYEDAALKSLANELGVTQ